MEDIISQAEHALTVIRISLTGVNIRYRQPAGVGRGFLKGFLDQSKPQLAFIKKKCYCYASL
jgi:hypothetical protein